MHRKKGVGLPGLGRMTVIVALWVSGCVSGGPSEGLEVIERSKREPPAWGELEPGALHAAGATLRYTHREASVAELALGLKQAQIQALQGAEAAVAKRIDRLVPEESLRTEDAREALETYLEEAKTSTLGDQFRVADVYFEKLRRTASEALPAPEEFYRIYVLVSVPQTVGKEVREQLAARLIESSEPELVKIGQKLLGESVDRGRTGSP